MIAHEQTTRLRRERNGFAVFAVVLILATIGVSLPRALARRDKLKGLNNELLALQQSIVAVQERTRGVQAEILKTQDEIRALQSRR